MLILFSITLFVSALLLFLLQPMFAKMALPLLGGAPAVWNTFLVFFQISLLAGYVYAHVTTRWLSVRRQVAVHTVLLLLPLLTLPIGVPDGWMPPAQQNPIYWLLGLLLVSVGLPFFIVSTSSPMLQKWFAQTSHPLARDPYFLYAASNGGSLLALLGYPLLLEPNLRLSEQSWVWTGGYTLLVLLVLSCAAVLWRQSRSTEQELGLGRGQNLDSFAASAVGAAQPTMGRRVHWVVLAFVPSSLLLGVTTFLTTDLPAMPLFWTVPLAIYLLSFVLVFARKAILPHEIMVRNLPFVIMLLLVWIVLTGKQPLWLAVVLHLVAFFIVTMVCHGELVQRRPPTRFLTEFYIWMALGGVLGGIFNALVAPLIFFQTVEYPMALIAACLLNPTAMHIVQNRLNRWLDFALPLGLGALLVGLVWVVNASELETGVFSVGLTYGLPLAICFTFHERPVRFGLSVGAIMLATTVSLGQQGRVLYSERSFFGVYRVMMDSRQKYHLLIHGSTNHGMQSLDPSRRNEPLSYYHSTGPLGQVFQVSSWTRVNSKVAIVGLGSGSMACYGKPGQHFIFYEIDPVIERIARNPQFFTFLRDCPPQIEVVLGDARLSLLSAPDGVYGMVVLDAFSSEAIPMHLLTREAIQLYLSKLADGGLLVFHVSNQNLNLRPILSDLARDAGLVAVIRDDSIIHGTPTSKGKLSSRWVVMARTEKDLVRFSRDPRWVSANGGPNGRVWTDDFSNILSVIRWNQL